MNNFSLDERVQTVRVDDKSLAADLMDGRTIIVPLTRFPSVLNATPEQRSNYQIVRDGSGVHWPDLNQELTIEQFLARTARPASILRKIAHPPGIAAIVVILAAALWIGLRSEARNESGRWLTYLPYSGLDTKQPDRTVLESRDLPREEIARIRLQQQIRTIRNRSRFHATVMRDLYVRHFTSLSMATILAIVAAFCLAHITRVGWEKADRKIVAAFTVAAGAALFFRLSPGLFRQDQNITENRALYLNYVALDGEITSYLATGKRVDNDSAMSIVDFVSYVERRRIALNQLPLGFDETKIPQYGSIQTAGEQTSVVP